MLLLRTSIILPKTNQVKDEEDFIWLRTGDRIGDQVISSNDPMHTQLVEFLEARLVELEEEFEKLEIPRS